MPHFSAAMYRVRSSLMVVLWACALALPALSSATAETVLPGGQGLIDANLEAEVLLEEPGEALTAEKVMSTELASRWETYPDKKINLQTERRALWVRLRLHQAGGQPLNHWVLALEWPLLDAVQFALFDTGGAGRAGPMRVRAEAPTALLSQELVPTLHFALKPEARVTVVLRAHSESLLSVPLFLTSETEWQARRSGTFMAMGVLFGILGVMFFYNLSLFVFTGDRSYGAYVLYLLMIIAYELVTTGVGRFYLWGEHAWFRSHGYGLFAAGSFLSAAWFFRVFLKLDEAARHLNRLNQAVLTFWLVTVAFVPFVLTRWMVDAMTVSGMLAGVAGIYTATYLVRRGNVSARYLLLAWLTLIGATMLTLLSMMGVLNGGFWIDQSQHVGFVIETVLLSMALAERIRRDRLSRESARREALVLALRVDQEREAKLQAQAQALDVQRRANEELELRVLERTSELKRAMDDVELINHELARLTVTDGLTKVHNRRYFDEMLQKEFDRSARAQSPLALLLADIDLFKKINDSVGHVAGDECLRLVAAAMRSCAGRSTDLVARYGGEEFAILLPSTAANDALLMAERMRKAVEAIAFIFHGQRVPISISLGVAVCVADPHQRVTDFVQAADHALYAAKTGGRNQVKLAA
jgi:two-component system, sensor histidine kinase LadS